MSVMTNRHFCPQYHKVIADTLFAMFLEGLYDEDETDHDYWDILITERPANPSIL